MSSLEPPVPEEPGFKVTCTVPPPSSLPKRISFGERLLDPVLDEPAHRARAHLAIVAFLREPLAHFRRDLNLDALGEKLGLSSSSSCLPTTWPTVTGSSGLK